MGITFMLIAGRTLEHCNQLNLVNPIMALWSACSHSGVVLLRGCEGRNICEADLSSVLQPVLAKALHGQVNRILKKWKLSASILSVALACARLHGVRQDNDKQFLRAAATLGKTAIDIIEDTFLCDGVGGRLTTTTLPAGAFQSFRYKHGKSSTHADPRLQAGFARIGEVISHTVVKAGIRLYTAVGWTFHLHFVDKAKKLRYFCMLYSM